MNVEKVFSDTQVVKLAYRVMDGDLAIIGQMIKEGVNVKTVGYQGLTLSHYALLAKKNRPQTLQLLLDAGADPVSLRADGENVPQIAVKRDNAEVAVLQVLFEYGISPNWYPPAGTIYADLSLLQAAIRGHNLPIVKFLLQKGADINYVDPFGGSALHYALSATRFDIAALLVDSGIDLSLKNHTSPKITKPKPTTALDYFCRTNGGKRGANPLPEIAQGWKLLIASLARRGVTMPCRL